MNLHDISSRQYRFERLCEAVKHCTLCPLCDGRERVLSSANGNINSRILFVAEAPGRLGADRTGIPLMGDQTGENFDRLLCSRNWSRDDLFITNAVLCNPRSPAGTNRTPTPREVANCSPYLEMVISLVDPEVVVSLGSTALGALSEICPHPYNLAKHVASPVPWAGRILFPLYHPGPRAMVHRPFKKQTEDLVRLADIVDPRTVLANPHLPKPSDQLQPGTSEPYSSMQRLIVAIIQAVGRMTYFKLTKLLYLADLNALSSTGATISGELYIRAAEGPWPPALRSQIKSLAGWEITLHFRGRTPIVEPGPSPRNMEQFEYPCLEAIARVLDRYGSLSDAGIKMAAYRTTPMRYVRDQEKLGVNMASRPIIYKNSSIDMLSSHL